MKLLFENKSATKPLVSFILLDWSCRDSFHFLHYLNNQVVSRELYEVIWIEYYDRQAPQIKKLLEESEQLNKPHVIDKWILIEMPKEYYYHKHLMYNIGILYGSGDIIVICDSDGIVKPTFVQSIIEEFAKDPNIVLHLDQLRNHDQKYYPFNYPAIAEIEQGSANRVNGKPLGLVDTLDTLHNRNYGACFCAKRAEVIDIGGADEHLDYLGHICGPYELTFRLVNAGKIEKWHQTEWMYHVWHPGQSGDENFVGPQDGRNMSTTALDIIRSKRVRPLTENQFIVKLRESDQHICTVPFSELITTIMHEERIKQWKVDFEQTSPDVFDCYNQNIALYSFAKPENVINPEISVLLPTLRPDKARKCIDSIAQTSQGVNYEMVVVSPLDMCNLLVGCQGYERLRFVREEKPEGCNKAFTTAYEHAAGKYVFAIADDHRLGQDCLKNLIEFMRPHDQEIFLAGARCYGVYGAGPESKTYGFYYAYTPCIRRDLAKQVGGFYDPHYRSYYGDPDLSMRVWHHGGKVKLCLDAWVEYHNELDNLDLEAHTNNSARDFHAFYQRWHPIYGHLTKSSQENDINICTNVVLPGIPPEKCTRLVVFLRQLDWSVLRNELASAHNIPLNPEHLFPVFKEMLIHIHLAPTEIIQDLAEWLIQKLLAHTATLRDKDLSVEPMKPLDISSSPNASDLYLAVITMFYLSGGLRKELELVVDNYRGINILYGRRKFHTWPCSLGGFSLQIFDETSNPLAFCQPTIYQALQKIDELLEGTPLVDWQTVRNIEDFFATADLEELQTNKEPHPVLEKLPSEICLQIVLSLKLKDWATIEQLLNGTSENVFIIKNYLCYVYGELFNTIKMVPPQLVLKLAQWLLGQLAVFSPNIGEVIESRGDYIHLAVFGYRHYNIVHCGGQYFGWPWSAGGFSQVDYTNGTVPMAVAGRSITEAKKLIDEKLGSPTEAEENQHDWPAEQELETVITGHQIENQADGIHLEVSGYRQYNIVRYKGLYFGWPWSAGEFSLQRYMDRSDLPAVVSKTVINAQRLIDIKLGLPTPEEENQDIPPKKTRFLLIKTVGGGFWSDMHDVWGKLLLAEITNRYPIVFWSGSNRYSVGDNCNSFEEYFLPVSEYSIRDVVNDQFTYYPPIWTHSNVLQDDPTRMSEVYRDIPDLINSPANVVVSDTHHCILYKVLPWVKQGHPVFGLWGNDVCRYIINKYQKLQPDIATEIDEFYNAHHMETGPILAVHIRSGDLVKELPLLLEINEEYPQEIDCYLRDNPSARIFLLTDGEDVLEQYKQMYGDILIYTECSRKKTNGLDPVVQIFPDRRRKGIEIIKDSYLASRCDAFIGNGYSNVSIAISRLKDWDKDRIKLLWKPAPSEK